MWELVESFPTRHGVVRWTCAGRGSPVVLLHGTPFSSRVWHDVATGLARRHTVYLWDMPGYGRSEMRAGQDVSFVAQQEVFTDLLREWGLIEPAVVAHDVGGTVALRAALLSGVRYARLALVDAVSVRPWGSDFFRLVRENAEVFGQLPGSLHEALVRRYLVSAAHRVLPADLLAELARPWLGAVGQDAFYRQIAQADERFTQEMEDRYPELDLPVLVAWGAEDAWLPVDRAHTLAGVIPNARLEMIAQAGHLVQFDAPGALTALLDEFLAD
ncbi:putative hydrolase or acyltransferase of alpha/beta superfamily [Actinoalloteichus sp. GBA129-24]|uniref:Hydrolase or acyltransferase of alpha/beta superfamily n=2 Tax=Pseudonocardiaceae TaxID=2070 RepID=A0AAC9LDS9_9PSEU|nr:putative hydrolase or acyltransferase of alpha/beta superfamily [Actinoalloteichus fjordicus]APU21051.1 putative hydrolase or acyltransferase of alpha/beta superfamily [Actinoalloteichus sp. GBA129-24]